DEGACMPDTDPPHEVADRVTPRDRNVDAPDADPDDEQIPDRQEENERAEKRDPESAPPAPRPAPRQNGVGDFVVDARITPSRPQHADIARDRRRRSGDRTAHAAAGSGSMIFARYVVRGRVLSSASSV